MGTTTAISWTDHTFNPWWGCARVSEGCRFCYAESSANRWGHDVWGEDAPRRFFGDAHWTHPLKWDRDALTVLGRPARVFCASMADVFEDRADLVEPRARLWDLVLRTPNLRWQFLTKRPENVHWMVPGWWLHEDAVQEWERRVPVRRLNRWPNNVWIGTTTENQARALERVPHLLALPAPVRFLSYEPALGPLDLDQPGWLLPQATLCGRGPGSPHTSAVVADALRAMGRRLGWHGIDWVIAGGESGPKRRPFDLAWARAVRDQCAAAGAAFFFKQDGGLRSGTPGPPDLEAHKAFPVAP